MNSDKESLALTARESADNIVSALLGVPVAYAATEIARTNLTQCYPCPDTLFVLSLLVILLLAYGLFSVTLLHNVYQASHYVQNQIWRRFLLSFFLVVSTSSLGGIILLGVFNDVNSFCFKTNLVFTLTAMSGSLCPVAMFGSDNAARQTFRLSIAIFVGFMSILLVF